MQTHEGLFTSSSLGPSAPTQWSRDLDPEVGFSLVLRAGLGDLQKGWSNFSKFCLHSDVGLSRALSSVLICQGLHQTCP